MPSLGQIYLDSAIKRLLTYKELGDKTFAQLNDKDFHFCPNAASNSIATIIRHLSGNMISRWTNFLTEDGEKPWRNRETEFAAPNTAPGSDTPLEDRAALLEAWERGWSTLLDTLRSLEDNDLTKTIHIRHEPLIAIDAINRQLAHYPSHVGQIVYIGRLIKDQDWQSLSIPKGASDDFNQKMKTQYTGGHK